MQDLLLCAVCNILLLHVITPRSIVYTLIQPEYLGSYIIYRFWRREAGATRLRHGPVVKSVRADELDQKLAQQVQLPQQGQSRT